MSQGSNIKIMLLEMAETGKSYFLKNNGGHQGNQTIPIELTASGINSSRSKRKRKKKRKKKKKIDLIKNKHYMRLFDGLISQKNHYLSTSVSKMIPKSALLSRTAWVIAFIAVLSSGFGIWFGNKPDTKTDFYLKHQSRNN